MFWVLRQHPVRRWVFLAALVGFYPAIIGLTYLVRDVGWLSLALLPPIIGMLGFNLAVGNSLMIFSIIFFWFAGVREVDALYRLEMLFHIPVILIIWIFSLIFQHRNIKREIEDQRHLDVIAERLTLIREQYKTDLIVNVSNQKKFQKCSLLNRVSRVFGSQLKLEKLAEKVLIEVREIIGAERGRYQLVFDFPDKKESLVQGIPEQPDADQVAGDQYGSWTTQHCSTLLVCDTNDDFRFQPLGHETMVRSLMIAPMMAEGKLIGILRAESPWENIFTKDDLRLFTIIADLAAVAAENARLYQYAQELAITDGLTGLYLRRFFNQRFEEELSRNREHATPFSLFILDLDHFKRINDRLGHLAGDQILSQLGELLREEARVADLLCRFGGEEFAIILPNTQIEGALVMAERLRDRVAKQTFIAGGTEMSITVSGGIGECPRHGTDMNELIRITDEALYTAKRNGRNRIVLAGGDS